MPRLWPAGVVAFGASLWLAWIVGAPALATAAPDARVLVGASALVYRLGGLVCHQQATRSLHMHGAKLPVCARCTGLYAGGALGATAVVGWLGLTRRRKPARLVLPAVRLALVLSALPTAVLWLGEHGLGLTVPSAVRMAGALPLGAAMAALAAAVSAGLRAADSAGPPGVH